MTKDEVVTGHWICSPQNHCFYFKLGYLITASARTQVRLNFDRNVLALLVRLIFR